jgi:putative hydrolase of the HAD superfamily
MIANVEAVLFDAVGTLIEPDPPVAVVYHAAGRQFGSLLSGEEIPRRFRDAFARQERLDAAQYGDNTDELRERRRWQSIVGEVFDDAADGEGLFDALWRHFAQPTSWRLCPGAAECWRRLAERGLTLGIASNFDGRLETVCRGLPPVAACRQFFISSQLGVRKPAREFFAAVEARLQMAPQRLLLAGDDLTNDYEGARAAGWQSVLIDPAERCAVEHRIRSLAELPQLIK